MTIAVVVKAGKVHPNAETVRVGAGQRIRITLASDVPESIHVHDYDLTVEASNGKPGTLRFTADRKGLFEVETHETEKLVARLIVS